MTNKLKVFKEDVPQKRRTKQSWMENDTSSSAYETLFKTIFHVATQNGEVIASYYHEEDAIDLAKRLSMSDKKIQLIEKALKRKALELCRKLIKRQADEVKEWKKKALQRRELALGGAPVPEEFFDLTSVFKTEKIFEKIDELK